MSVGTLKIKTFYKNMALDTNLISFWKFDESSGNASDALGSYNLTNNNTVGYATGKINNGADFGSGNTNKDFTIPSGFTNLASNAAFSFSFWIKTTDTTNNPFVSSRCNSSAHAQWNIMKHNSGYILFEISPANSSSNRMSVKNTTGNSLHDGNWHHVVITKAANRLTSGVKIYIDGTSCTVADDSTNTLSSDAPTGTAGAIGSRTATFGNFWNGMIDAFGIWSRELDATDVASLYNSGTGVQYPFATNVTVSATVVSVTASIPASTVSGGANVAPAVQAATFSVPASAVSGGATVASSVLSAVFSLPTVNVITPDAQILATVLTATFSLPTATPSGGASVDATVQSATFSIPAVSFIGSVSITPDAQVATFTTLAPTISAIGNVTVSATAVAATFSLQSPTVTAEQNAMFNAGVLSATFSVQSPTITAIRNVTIDASVISATFSIPTPLRKVGGLWTAQPRAQGVWTPQPRAI